MSCVSMATLLTNQRSRLLLHDSVLDFFFFPVFAAFPPPVCDYGKLFNGNRVEEGE